VRKNLERVRVPLKPKQALDAPFWTADKRLYNNASQPGFGWNFWMGEFDSRDNFT
jgi:hypothetical protein